MLKIEDMARKAAGLPVGRVHAAWDLSSISVPTRDEHDDTGSN
jgi:hypothetical protein